MEKITLPILESPEQEQLCKDYEFIQRITNTWLTVMIVFCFGVAIIALVWGIAMYRLISEFK